MGRRLPPFSSVRAFEAAARHLSFRLAADELCLSPSAISHQIRGLEEYLDTALFERQGNRMALTLTGRGYADKLTFLLDIFDESTRSVREAGGRPFRLLCTPGFAARWLIPRLDRLSFSHRVRLRISTGAPSTDFTSNDSDAVIQWSNAPVSGVRSDVLLSSGRYPVASPRFRERENIRVPEDLLRVTLMHDEMQDAWAEWFAAAGIEPPVLPHGPVLANCELATTAAERGQGIALAYDAMVRGALAEGRLVRLFDTVTMPVVIYSLACPETRADDPMIQEFRDWIFREVAADGILPYRFSAAV